MSSFTLQADPAASLPLRLPGVIAVQPATQVTGTLALQLKFQGMADTSFRPVGATRFVLPEFTPPILQFPQRVHFDRFLRRHQELRNAVDESTLLRWQAYDVVRQAQILSECSPSVLATSLASGLNFLTSKTVGPDIAHGLLLDIIRNTDLHVEDSLTHLPLGWAALEGIGYSDDEIPGTISRITELSKESAYMVFLRMAQAGHRLTPSHLRLHQHRPRRTGTETWEPTRSQMDKIHRIKLYDRGDTRMNREEYLAYVLRGDPNERTASDHRLYLRFKRSLAAPYRRYVESIEKSHDELSSVTDEGRVLRAELYALFYDNLTNQEWRALVLWGDRDLAKISDNTTYSRFKDGLPYSWLARLEAAESTALSNITERQLVRMERARLADQAGEVMISKVWQCYLIYGDQVEGKDPRITVREYNRFKEKLSAQFRNELEEIESRVIRRETPSTDPKLTSKQDARIKRVQAALEAGESMSYPEWWAYVLRGERHTWKPRDRTTFSDFKRSLPKGYQRFLDRAKAELEIGGQIPN